MSLLLLLRSPADAGVSVNAEAADAAGDAQAPTVAVAPTAATAETTGVANQATAALSKDVTAATAEASATANGAAVSIQVLAQLAAALADALNATTPPAAPTDVIGRATSTLAAAAATSTLIMEP